MCVYTDVHEAETLYIIFNYPQTKIKPLIIIFITDSEIYTEVIFKKL